MSIDSVWTQGRHWMAALLIIDSLSTLASDAPRLALSGTTDAIKLIVNGAPGAGYGAQASSDLHAWDSVAVVYPESGVFPANAQFELTDYESVFNERRLYRALALTGRWSRQGQHRHHPRLSVFDLQ